MSDLPKGWVETKLGSNIVDIAMGPFGSNLKVDSFIDSGVPVIKGGNLSENFVSGNFSFVSEEKASSLRRSVAHAGDIIITHRGTLGQVSLVPTGKYERYVTSQSQLRFTTDEQKVDKNYLLYFLKSRIGQYELLLNASQVGVPAIATPTKAIKEINLCLPPLPEQKAIADMLSSFDEKIEMLREQNKTLETLAQSIFKEWFVNFNYPNATGDMVESDNPLAGKTTEGSPLEGESVSSNQLGLIPKGWRVGKLGEIAEIGSGKRPKNKSEKKSESHDIPLIGATKIMGYVESYLYDEDIIVIGRVGTHGEIQRFSEKVWASDNTLVIKSNNLDFVYFILTGVDYEVMNRGAVQPLITQTDLKNYPVIVPSDGVMMQFNECIKPIFEKVKSNSSQIQTLSKTRDTLLPKLMTGQVRAGGKVA